MTRRVQILRRVFNPMTRRVHLLRHQFCNMDTMPGVHFLYRLPHPKLAIEHTLNIVFACQIYIFIESHILKGFFVVTFFAIINIDVLLDIAEQRVHIFALLSGSNVQNIHINGGVLASMGKHMIHVVAYIGHYAEHGRSRIRGQPMIHVCSGDQYLGR